MPEAISGRILFRAVSKLVLLLSSFVKFRFLLRLSTRRVHSLRKKLVFLAGKAKLPNLKPGPSPSSIRKKLFVGLLLSGPIPTAQLRPAAESDCG